MNMMVSPINGLMDAGSLEVRLARGPAEMGAVSSPAMKTERRDFDAYDVVADHLLVIDHARSAEPQFGHVSG